MADLWIDDEDRKCHMACAQFNPTIFCGMGCTRLAEERRAARQAERRRTEPRQSWVARLMAWLRSDL